MVIDSKAKIPASALRAWRDLSRNEQLSVLTRLSSRRRTSLQRVHKDVLTVGVGYKTVKGKLERDLCLAFLVKEKHPEAAEIPKYLSTYVTKNRRRQLVAVPTDVEELGAGGPQRGINVSTGISAVAADNPTVSATGAVCCLVRQVDKPENIFALGCHHVLALSVRTQSCAAKPSFIAAGPNGTPIGKLHAYCPMAANVRGQVDAAIALLDPKVPVVWEHNGLKPLSVEAGDREPRSCRVFTPRGAFPAHYVKTWPQIALEYPTCGWVHFDYLYQFQAPTIPGDSGSPILGADGTLFGMHFWGDPMRSLSYAIPASTLFRKNLFPVSLELLH